MTKEESTKILSFITPGARVLVLGHLYNGSENAMFLILSCVHWGMDQILSI